MKIPENDMKKCFFLLDVASQNLTVPSLCLKEETGITGIIKKYCICIYN